MAILVTGGLGYIGSHAGDQVRILQQVVARGGKEPAQQGRLAGAPRAGHDHRREGAGRLADLGREQAGNMPHMTILN